MSKRSLMRCDSAVLPWPARLCSPCGRCSLVQELCGAYAQQKFNIHREEVTKGDWVHVDAVAAPAVIETAAFVHGVRAARLRAQAGC